MISFLRFPLSHLPSSYPEKLTGTKIPLSRGFMMVKSAGSFFYIHSETGHLKQFFNMIIRVLFVSFAISNPHRLIFICGCVLKLKKIEKAFQNGEKLELILKQRHL